MSTITILFDDETNFTYDAAGIEFTGGSAQLIDPTGLESYALYFKIVLDEGVIQAETVYTTEHGDIPIVIYPNEPTLVKVKEDTLLSNDALQDIWAVLAPKKAGIYYIGMLLGAKRRVYEGFPPADPYSYWTLDNSSWLDSSSNNYHLTKQYTPVIYPEDGIDGAAYFNGSAYLWLNQSSGFHLLGDCTISMNLKPTSFAARRNPWCRNYGGEGCITQETSGVLNYYYGTNGGNAAPYQGFGSGESLILNQWNRVTIVRDLAKMRLFWYFDEDEVNQTPASYSYAQTSTSSILLGEGYANQYLGYIDDVLIYDRALGAMEVATLYTRSSKDEEVSNGQATVTSIIIRTKETITFNIGNVTKERGFSYLGSNTNDTLVHFDGIIEALADYSNVYVSQDKKELPYLILKEGSGSADVIVKTNYMKENLIVSINDTDDSAWSCDALVGNGMDFRNNKGIIGTGPITYDGDTYEFTVGGTFSTTLPPIVDRDITLHLLFVVRKTLSGGGEYSIIDVTIGDQIFSLSLNDDEATLIFDGHEIEKPDHPWLSNYVQFDFRIGSSLMILAINNQIVYTKNIMIYDKYQSSVSLKSTTGPCQLRAYYMGPLALSESEFNDMDNMEPEIIVTGKTDCIGAMFYAGSAILDAWAQLYIIDNRIYRDNKIYAPTPELDLDDPVLFGIKDLVNNNETLYYGSTSEYGVYIYEDNDWRLFEPNMRLYSIWRSIHTEGLIIQREGDNSMKIYLFKRDKETSKLVYNKDIIFTGLPEDGEYKFEPTMDRRVNRKTSAWTWAIDKALTS